MSFLMEVPSIIWLSVATIGTIWVAKRFTILWRLFHTSTIHRYAHGNAPWALVTGASDGIGKGYVCSS